MTHSPFRGIVTRSSRIPFGFARLNSFEGAGAAFCGVQPGLSPSQAAQDAGDFPLKALGAFDLLQNLIVRNRMACSAFRAGDLQFNSFPQRKHRLGSRSINPNAAFRQSPREKSSLSPPSAGHLHHMFLPVWAR